MPPYEALLQFPDSSLSAAASYCRNPNRRPSGIWCFVETGIPGDTAWESCHVPVCNGRFYMDILSEGNLI